VDTPIKVFRSLWLLTMPTDTEWQKQTVSTIFVTTQS